MTKVFISYAWTNSQRVLELAAQLIGHGVEVMLDKWDLKEGHDKHKFMERSVVDPSIDKVLMICDKVYAEKANARKGGVGDETMIISSEVYGEVEQEKFIPIIFERDENGKEYTPAYLKSRIYIDLCSDNPQYEEEYEKLLRNLHNRPEYRKPALGKIPEWLNDEKVDFSSIPNLLKQIRADDGRNKSKTDCNVRDFCDKFIVTLLSLAPAYNKEDFDEKLLVQIDAAKPLRDLFFDYVEALLRMSDLDVATALGDFFEKVYNETYVIEGNSYREPEFEFRKFLIWEMFLGLTAILLHYEKYLILKNLLQWTYFLKLRPFDQNAEANNFMQFWPAFSSSYIETHIKPKSEKSNLCTLAGSIVIQREKQPIVSCQSLVNADSVLYQLSLVYNHLFQYSFRSYWFPVLYVYGERFDRQSIWSKMVSFQHCQKLFPLFGITKLEQLKDIVEKSKPNREMRYDNYFESAPSIQQSINLDEIGTMP